MISTAAILIPLIALFLLGIKMTTDLIREWQRKKALSSYAQERRWRQSDRYCSAIRIDIGAFVAGLKNLARLVRKAAVTPSPTHNPHYTHNQLLKDVKDKAQDNRSFR